MEQAQARLLSAMMLIRHDDEAGHAVKDLLTSTATLLPLIIPTFVGSNAEIYSPKRMQQYLSEFAEELLLTQARWAREWEYKRHGEVEGDDREFKGNANVRCSCSWCGGE